MQIDELKRVIIIESKETFAEKELVENGLAELYQNHLIIPFAHLRHIEPAELVDLSLPPLNTFRIKIDYKSSLGRPDFKFEKRFFDDLNSEVFPTQIGPFLKLSDDFFTLRKEEFDALELCNDSNKHQAEDKNSGYYALPLLQKAAEKKVVELHSFLLNQHVIVPENVSVEPDLEGEDIIVLPSLESEDKEINVAFKERFKRFNVNVNSKAHSIYGVNTSNESNSVRIVFKPSVVEELGKIKPLAKPHKTGEFVKKFDDPFLGLNPDIIDLEQFSARVRAVGIYVPNTKLVAKQFKTQWFPEIVFSLPGGGDMSFDFSNEELIAELEILLSEAQKNGQSRFKFKDFWISVMDAEQIIDFSTKQNASKKEPVLYSKSSRKVLIIEENIDDVGTEEKIADFLNETKAKFVPPPNLKPEFNLLEHQVEGVAWMQTMFKDKGVPGVLLADDMGLGKTLQVLSFIDWHFNWQAKNGEERPYLIVAPVALLENWIQEHNRFFNPILKFHAYYGSTRNHVDLASLCKADLVLTSYETLVRDQLKLGSIHWAAVFLDEAQKIKSPSTLTTNTAKALNANFKVALTGTPVENSLLDFWCIIDFVYPGYLGSAKEFMKEFKVGDSTESDFDNIGKRIRLRVQTLLLRRLKKDILTSLPRKHSIPFSWNGKDLHPASEFMPRKQETVYKREINEKVLIKQHNGKLEQNEIFELIRNLRSICDHPDLVGSTTLLNIKTSGLIGESAKLLKTLEIIENVKRKEEKVIVFTDRKAVQRLLQNVCKDAFGIEVSVINGETPSIATSGKESRLAVLNEFQRKLGFNLIIMSPIAAGFGLNATEANHVIHFTRHWNPAKEDQATDRVYRIGQEKEVFVYYPMSLLSDIETFDVKIHELLSRKRALSESTLFPSEKLEVSNQELLDLLIK